MKYGSHIHLIKIMCFINAIFIAKFYAYIIIWQTIERRETFFLSVNFRFVTFLSKKYYAILNLNLIFLIPTLSHLKLSKYAGLIIKAHRRG